MEQFKQLDRKRNKCGEIEWTAFGPQDFSPAILLDVLLEISIRLMALLLGSAHV